MTSDDSDEEMSLAASRNRKRKAPTVSEGKRKRSRLSSESPESSSSESSKKLSLAKSTTDSSDDCLQNLTIKAAKKQPTNPKRIRKMNSAKVDAVLEMKEKNSKQESDKKPAKISEKKRVSDTGGPSSSNSSDDSDGEVLKKSKKDTGKLPSSSKKKKSDVVTTEGREESHSGLSEVENSVENVNEDDKEHSIQKVAEIREDSSDSNQEKGSHTRNVENENKLPSGVSSENDDEGKTVKDSASDGRKPVKVQATTQREISGSSSSDDDEETLKALREDHAKLPSKKRTRSSGTAKSIEKSGSDDSDEELKPKSKKKEAQKSETNKGEDDSSRFKRLRKLCALAGLRFKYKDLQGVKSESKRYQILRNFMIEKGITKFSIKECKEFKQRKEQEAEVAELQKNVIIGPESERRVTRSRRRQEREAQWNSRRAHLSTSSSGDESDRKHAQEENQEIFSRLKGIVSDDSD